MTKRLGRLAPALILALCQLSLFAQSPARAPGPAEQAKKIMTDSASR